LEVSTLFLIMRKRLNGIHGPDIARGTGAAILGTLGMTAALVIWMYKAGSTHAALTTLGGVVIGGMVYGVVLLLLRVPEVGSLFRIIKRRFSH
jgi:hypothetical protein